MGVACTSLKTFNASKKAYLGRSQNLVVASQSVQSVHHVVQSLCLFPVIAGCLKQFSRPKHNRLLRSRNALRQLVLINLRERSSIQLPPLSAVRSLGNIGIHISILELDQDADCIGQSEPLTDASHAKIS
jgi:hypothetical protein